MNSSPAAVYKQLTDGSDWSLLNFRDASGGPPLFDISLLDVLHGIKVAHDARFFDFDHFDAEQYLFYEVSLVCETIFDKKNPQRMDAYANHDSFKRAILVYMSMPTSLISRSINSFASLLNSTVRMEARRNG